MESMSYDDYYNGYLHFLGQAFANDPDTYEAAIDVMEQSDPDEWEHRGTYRQYLSTHPAMSFTECRTSGPQGICVEAGSFCDHAMTTHNNAYWEDN